MQFSNIAAMYLYHVEL